MQPDHPRKLTLMRHADHDPGLACRPALGYGLCEVLQPGQVPPGHPDAARPAARGEHPRDCDCGDCP